MHFIQHNLHQRIFLKAILLLYICLCNILHAYYSKTQVTVQLIFVVLICDCKKYIFGQIRKTVEAGLCINSVASAVIGSEKKIMKEFFSHLMHKQMFFNCSGLLQGQQVYSQVDNGFLPMFSNLLPTQVNKMYKVFNVHRLTLPNMHYSHYCV